MKSEEIITAEDFAKAIRQLIKEGWIKDETNH